MELKQRDEIVKEVMVIVLILIAVLVSVLDLDDIREFIIWLGIKEEVKWILRM